MAVVVFDGDVLIGFLNRDDAQHARAVAVIRGSLAPGTRRLLSAVNYAEILVGPVRAGTEQRVEQMLARLSVEVVAVDRALARQAAAVRERTNLKLPDAFALATALYAEHRGWRDVTLASFDADVLRAHAALQRGP
jgi:predicted nucleic acid-binding protein